MLYNTFINIVPQLLTFTWNSVIFLNFFLERNLIITIYSYCHVMCRQRFKLLLCFNERNWIRALVSHVAWGLRFEGLSGPLVRPRCLNDCRLRRHMRQEEPSWYRLVSAGSWSLTLLLSSFQRPLFVLADRNVDMATPLHHSWTYQALIHDVLVSHMSCQQGVQKQF